jgi:hypothetical protein
MTILNLNRGQVSDLNTSVRERIGNAYQRFAQTDVYQKNRRSLTNIQLGVVILSAVSTGITNALAHRKRIGDLAAVALAFLVVAFVERFYVVLQSGLASVYKSGKQRFYASVAYRVIQATMILNGATLVAWIVGLSLPPWLELWNHWSICVHFGLALIALPAILDADAVVQNRLLELKAETARQDIVTARKASAIGSPLALFAANLRGLFDTIALSARLLFSGGGFAKKFMQELAQVEAEQYGYLDALPAGRTTTLPAQRRPGFVTNQAGQQSPGQSPNGPGSWI